jgi:hypothetical protein
MWLLLATLLPPLVFVCSFSLVVLFLLRNVPSPASRHHQQAGADRQQAGADRQQVPRATGSCAFWADFLFCRKPKANQVP